MDFWKKITAFNLEGQIKANLDMLKNDFHNFVWFTSLLKKGQIKGELKVKLREGCL